ncbi:MAG: UPF0058 family protein [Candidatus Aenigmatarchaeota archaeon]
MKKQDLIHLHGLLDLAKDFYEENTAEKVESNRYIDLGVRPTSIHRSKSDHKAAVFALSGGIVQEVNEPGSTSYDFEAYFEELAEQAVRSGVEFDLSPVAVEEDVEFGAYHILSGDDVELNDMVLDALDGSKDSGVTYHRGLDRITVSSDLVEEYLEDVEDKPVRI